MWVNEELVPQVETAPDPSVMVDEALLALGGKESAGLSEMVADLQVEVVLSNDRSELRALRQAADAADQEWRSMDDEVRLTVPTPIGRRVDGRVGSADAGRAGEVR